MATKITPHGDDDDDDDDGGGGDRNVDGCCFA